MTGIDHKECCCKPYPWAGWIRHIDPKFNTQSDQEMVAHNNKYNKKWCEEMILEHKGLGGNKGIWNGVCDKPCTRDD